MENKSSQRSYSRLLKGVVVAALWVGLVIFPLGGEAIAYSVDYEMDKARVEKTIEHYGEPIRPIVEEAIKNNEDNPNSKDTAENTYQRENPLNQALPEQIGESFSKKELANMENSDD